MYGSHLKFFFFHFEICPQFHLLYISIFITEMIAGLKPDAFYSRGTKTTVIYNLIKVNFGGFEEIEDICK